MPSREVLCQLLNDEYPSTFEVSAKPSHPLPVLSTIFYQWRYHPGSRTTNTASPNSTNYPPSQTCTPCPSELNHHSSSLTSGSYHHIPLYHNSVPTQTLVSGSASQSTFLRLVLPPPISPQQGRKNVLSKEQMELFYASMRNAYLCPTPSSQHRGQHPVILRLSPPVCIFSPISPVMPSITLRAVCAALTC